MINFGDNFLGHISKIALKAEPEKLTEEKQEFYKTDRKREITDKMISIDKVFCLGEKERIIYNQLYNDKNIKTPISLKWQEEICLKILYPT